MNIIVNSLKHDEAGYPIDLKQLPHPPEPLFWAGADPSSWLSQPKVAIVGSRKATAYGRQTTEDFAYELAAAGVVIISGLALGIDAIAHQAALKAKGLTVAILPTAIERVYPATHLQLGHRIVTGGGTLISEYYPESPIHKANFIVRNRIVAALADVVLITEAARNSGTMHTARFALEQGKTVMAVPGNVNSAGSQGCNNLIRSGAVPACEVGDIFFALKLDTKKSKLKHFSGSDSEKQLLNLISSGVTELDEIAQASQLDATTINSTLTMLELNGHIRAAGGGHWVLAG